MLSFRWLLLDDFDLDEATSNKARTMQGRSRKIAFFLDGITLSLAMFQVMIAQR